MKLRIEERDGGLEVHIEEAAGRERALVEAIRRCRQSAWACTSGECVNIESIAERVEAGSVCLTLTPKAGLRLDAGGIRECLRYLLPQEL